MRQSVCTDKMSHLSSIKDYRRLLPWWRTAVTLRSVSVYLTDYFAVLKPEPLGEVLPVVALGVALVVVVTLPVFFSNLM